MHRGTVVRFYTGVRLYFAEPERPASMAPDKLKTAPLSLSHLPPFGLGVPARFAIPESAALSDGVLLRHVSSLCLDDELELVRLE
jgi:hypothetical protein